MPKAAKPKASKASKKPKAKKDPNAPKKPLSAYFLFAADNRARVKEENPDAGFGAMGKILGAEWKEASDEVKQKYAALQAKAKEAYEKAVKEYVPAGADDDEEEPAEEAADEEDDDE